MLTNKSILLISNPQKLTNKGVSLVSIPRMLTSKNVLLISIDEILTIKSVLLVSRPGFSRFSLVRKIEWPQITRPLDPKNLAPAKSLRLLRITFFSQEKA